MATGDLNNNVDKARNELTSIRYSGAWSSLGISEGSPEAYLPLIHYVCVDFSRFLARFLASKGYELAGKNDMRFMEEVYRIMRNEFNYRPALNLQQFFTVGFAERKLILVCDLIKLCKRKHNEINKQKADAKRKTVSSPSPSLLRPPSPQVNTSMDNSLRKSGGSLKSGNGLDSSQRRRSGSTGSNSGNTIPKKFVASASLVNNEIDVVDFKPSVSSARPPIRVIRNEPKQPTEPSSSLPHSSPPIPRSSTPQHPPTNHSYTPPAPSNPTSSFTSPAHFNSNYSTPSFYPSNPSNASIPTTNTLPSLPSNPSFPPPSAPFNRPLPSSSAYASRSADGAWRMQEANGYATRYSVGREGEEREDVMEVEDVAVIENEEEEEEEEESEEAPLPAAFKKVNMNGRMEGGEKKEDNGYSGASMNGNGGDGPITDKVAMHILDKMETKVLSSINSLQMSMVSLESRVKNLESMLGDSSLYQAPQQPSLANNPNKYTMNYHASPTTSSPPSSYPTYSTLPNSPPSTHYSHQVQDHHANKHHTNNNSHNNIHANDGNSDTSSTEKERYYKPSQSTQDFISSITKRFKDTRDLLDQQAKLQHDK